MKESPINILSDILDVNDSELTLRTFIESPEYLGSSSIYEWWKENMEGWPDDINEVIATGSLGGGKSYVVGAIYVIFRLVKLFQRGDLCKMFDLAPNTDIYIIYFSLSITLAKRTGFQYLFEVVDQCKWLREHYPRNQRLTSEIEFPNHVHIIYASAEGHQTGLNVLMFILDEANFRKGVGLGMEDEYAEVQQLAMQLEDRQLSRFLVDGKLQSLAVYISSASYQSSFIDKKIEEAEGVETSRVITCVKYKVTPEKYSKEKFEVFVGYGQIEPCIVESSQQKSGLIALTGLDPELCDKLFEMVPETLLPQFKKNIYLALQNHCGRSTSVKGSFFTNVSLLKESYTMDEPNPFVQDSVIISNKSDLLIQDAFDVSRLDPSKVDLPHSLFLDLSLQGDQGSLTCVRYDGMKDRVRYHSHLFTVSIIPPEYPAMTDIDKVTEFVLWLSESINIVALGSDQYQSSQIRQHVNKVLGLDDIRLSLDSSDVPFTHWVSALVSHRFKQRYYQRQEKEILEAQHDLKRRRIIKRPNSSDDQFQTLVGAFYLSDTVAAAQYDTGIDLVPDGRLNLIGGKSITQVLRQLGYDTLK